MMTRILERIEALRQKMREFNVQAVIIPSSDPHQSEYVAEHWQERVWISGFTGSAGLVVVTQTEAGLWTDSRYFIQAEQELENSGITLHKMLNQFEPTHINFLIDHLKAGDKVSMNGWMFSKAGYSNIKNALSAHHIECVSNVDLVGQIWNERPSLPKTKIIIHQEKFSGKSAKQKLSDVRSRMKDYGVDYHLITSLDDIGWTFNLRGYDVEYNPVFIAYALIQMDKAILFVDKAKLTEEVISHLNECNVECKNYTDILGILNELEETKSILIDDTICNHNLYKAVNAKIINGQSIPKFEKAIKNDIEIKHIRNAMKKDGVAIAESFFWLEKSLQSGDVVTEVDFANKLAVHRSAQPLYFGESFGAIIGYKSNGAIIHYHPKAETCKTIELDGILLVDNGGQFEDGTTDITRTIALSTPSAIQKKHYTLLLKGMISLSMAVFPKGTTGIQLDALARQYLWQHGLNYGHGTGHGVGFFMNVHEPPQGFAPNFSERGKTAHLPGMLSSNEPGYYIEGEYGMRIENLIVVKESKYDGFYDFETLTLYPFDISLIEKSMLVDQEINWINAYHNKCLEAILPHLSEETKLWFSLKCASI